MEDEIKVSELPLATQVNDADLLMIIQGQANKKIAAETFNSALDTRLDTAETNITNLKTYSTTETIIGTWIDGRPLYRKVIEFGTLPNATDKTVTTGLAAATTIIVNASGIAIGESGGNYFGITLPDMHVTSTSSSTRLTFITSSSNWQAVITTGTDRSNYSANIILEYYKTTDSTT